MILKEKEMVLGLTENKEPQIIKFGYFS